jgi:hypothetical protein
MRLWGFGNERPSTKPGRQRRCVQPDCSRATQPNRNRSATRPSTNVSAAHDKNCGSASGGSLSSEPSCGEYKRGNREALVQLPTSHSDLAACSGAGFGRCSGSHRGDRVRPCGGRKRLPNADLPFRDRRRGPVYCILGARNGGESRSAASIKIGRSVWS